MLSAAVDIDPNYVQLGILRANAAVAAFEYRSAIDGLEALSERRVPDGQRRRVLARLGEIYEDAEMPAEARTAYERAIPLATDPIEIGRYRQRIAMLAQWIESGTRARARAIDPHAGHDHGVSGDGAPDQAPDSATGDGSGAGSGEPDVHPEDHLGHDHPEHDHD
jgi:hypothetical protein